MTKFPRIRPSFLDLENFEYLDMFHSPTTLSFAFPIHLYYNQAFGVHWDQWGEFQRPNNKAYYWMENLEAKSDESRHERDSYFPSSGGKREWLLFPPEINKTDWEGKFNGFLFKIPIVLMVFINFYIKN